MVGEPKRSAITWHPAYRIVPSRFPTIDIFERFEDTHDWDALIELEIATNPRARDAIGDIELVPREERVGGPGSTAIMAAFMHLNPLGTRFSDGRYGVFYAARDRETAIDETVHHREIFLRRTTARPVDLDMRVYAVDVAGEFHDIRPLDAPAVYSCDDYIASQELGARLREAGSNGIVYRSVRRSGGECIAVFKARRLSRCRTDRHLSYRWDGSRITVIYERRPVRRR